MEALLPTLRIFLTMDILPLHCKNRAGAKTQGQEYKEAGRLVDNISHLSTLIVTIDNIERLATVEGGPGQGTYLL